MSAPDQRKRQVWPVVTLIAAGLVIATVAAVVSNATGERVEPAAAPVTQTITKTVTQSAPATVPAAAPAAPAPEGPAIGFTDGTHIVGLDVAPGDYRTAGPSGTNAGGCYWSRRKADGSSITDYGVVGGPGQITVRGGELVEVNGCQPWTRAT